MYDIKWTTCDALLTTGRDGKGEGAIDHIRRVIWVDERLSPSRQLRVVRDAVAKLRLELA